MCSTTTDPEYNIPDLEFEEKNTTRETNISVLQRKMNLSQTLDFSQKKKEY